MPYWYYYYCLLSWLYRQQANMAGKEIRITRPIRPLDKEFAIGAEHFIYCTNAKCEAKGTGLARVHNQGPKAPTHCKYCDRKFPPLANGKSFGGDRYAALLAGKPGGGDNTKRRTVRPNLAAGADNADIMRSSLLQNEQLISRPGGQGLTPRPATPLSSIPY